MAEPQFQHEHLRLSEGSIRLVQIHGTTNQNHPLSLRITQFATSKRPPYAAISYTWGTASRSVPITINGKPFAVRPNLYQLLLHLRQRGESRFLWVDALCIWQTNDTERNFHVQFMSRIYEEAELVIVWLGLPSDDRREARAIDFLVEMANHSPKKTGGATFRDLYLTAKAQSRWLNLLSFCKCVYWGRTWIIQEFVQAKRIEVLCGKAILDWSAFETVHKDVKALFHANTASSHVPSSLQDLLRSLLLTIPSRLTARRLAHTASSLVELLHEFYDAQCTLPRDKVYGMLGIAADCGPLFTASTDPTATSTYRGPVPDYAKHIVEVYFDVLAYLRDSCPTQSVAPLTVLLLQKSLGITEQSISHSTKSMSPDTLALTINNTNLHIKPDYMSTISAVLPSYTSISDLKQKLTQFDWSPYVGFEIVRPRTPTPAASTPRNSPRPSPAPSRSSTTSTPHTSSSASTTTSSSTLSPPASQSSHHYYRSSSYSSLSRQITQPAPLPPDLISNAVLLAASPILSHLPTCTYTYCSSPPLSNLNLSITSPPPSSLPTITAGTQNTGSHFHLPLSPLSLSPHDTIPPNSTTLPPTPTAPRPTVTLFIETSPLSHPLRLGFIFTTLTNTTSTPTSAVRRNDILLQFRGLNLTLIARRIGSSGTLQLIGHALMVTHAGLKHNNNNSNRFATEAEVHPASSSSTRGDAGTLLVSPCLVPVEEPASLDGGGGGGGGSGGGGSVLGGGSSSEGMEDQERVLWKEQWRDHLARYEDIEIETDALSLYEILRDA